MMSASVDLPAPDKPKNTDRRTGRDRDADIVEHQRGLRDVRRARIGEANAIDRQGSPQRDRLDISLAKARRQPAPRLLAPAACR